MLKETEITGKKCIKNKISEMENYGPHHRLYAKIILKSTTFNPTLLENRRGTQGQYSTCPKLVQKKNSIGKENSRRQMRSSSNKEKSKGKAQKGLARGVEEKENGEVFFFRNEIDK